MYLWRFLDFFGNDENDYIMKKNDPGNDKKFLCNFCYFFQKIPIFQSFYAIFVIFFDRQWIRMLKTFNKARIRCPIVFFEEINAVFKKRKNSQKIPKIFDF